MEAVREIILKFCLFLCNEIFPGLAEYFWILSFTVQLMFETSLELFKFFDELCFG